MKFQPLNLGQSSQLLVSSLFKEEHQLNMAARTDLCKVPLHHICISL